MTKKNQVHNSESSSNDDNQYLLVWDIQWTLLEKYIYKIIKESDDDSCSDEQIAEVLYLSVKEVKEVIESDKSKLKNIIQGDYSLRSIQADFTELEYIQGDIEKIRRPLKEEPSKNLGLNKEIAPNALLMDLENPSKYKLLEHKQLPKELVDLKAKAKKYYLVIKSKASQN